MPPSDRADRGSRHSSCAGRTPPGGNLAQRPPAQLPAGEAEGYRHDQAGLGLEGHRRWRKEPLIHIKERCRQTIMRFEERDSLRQPQPPPSRTISCTGSSPARVLYASKVWSISFSIPQESLNRFGDTGSVAVAITQFHRLGLRACQGQVLPNALGKRIAAADDAACESNAAILNDFDGGLGSAEIDERHRPRLC